jgi:hypothetical protein
LIDENSQSESPILENCECVDLPMDISILESATRRIPTSIRIGQRVASDSWLAHVLFTTLLDFWLPLVTESHCNDCRSLRQSVPHTRICTLFKHARKVPAQKAIVWLISSEFSNNYNMLWNLKLDSFGGTTSNDKKLSWILSSFPCCEFARRRVFTRGWFQVVTNDLSEQKLKWWIEVF